MLTKNFPQAIAYHSPTEFTTYTVGIFYIPTPTEDKPHHWDIIPLRQYFQIDKRDRKSLVIKHIGKTARDRARKQNKENSYVGR